MAITLKHKFKSLLPDSPDETLIRSSNWNDGHDLFLDGKGLIGRDATGTGAAKQLTFEETRINIGAAREPSQTGTDGVTNWNAVVTPGWHPSLLGQGNPNAPVAGVYFHCLVVNYFGNVTQYAIPYASNQGTWSRNVYNGVWTPWRRFYDQGNILGAMGMANGVPIGAIIERGANSNGQFIRFADGTQICIMNDLYLGPCDTTAGSMYESPYQGFAYPVTMVQADVNGFVMDTGSVNLIGVFGVYSISSCVAKLFSPYLISAGRRINIMAIGRWY